MIRLLILTVFLAGNVQAETKYKFINKRVSGGVSLQWKDQSGQLIPALTDELMRAAGSRSAKIQSAQSRGVEHAIVTIPKKGVAVLIPGEMIDAVALDTVPIRSYLIKSGFYYYAYESGKGINVRYFDAESSEDVSLVEGINHAELGRKVRIVFKEGLVHVERGDKSVAYGPQGKMGGVSRKTREISATAKEVLRKLNATDIVEEVKQGGLIEATWLSDKAAEIEKHLVAGNVLSRSVLIEGKGDQSHLINHIAGRLARGESDTLKGWKIYRIDPIHFSPDEFVATDVTMVRNTFNALSDQRLIVVFEGVHKFMIWGGDASTADKKATTAMAQYLKEGKVIVLGTLETENLKLVRSNPEFYRAFTEHNIPAPSEKEVLSVLRHRAKAIEKRDGVSFPEESLVHLVTHTRRHLSSQAEPGTEITAMEELVVQLKAKESVTAAEKDVRAWVGRKSNRRTLTNDSLQNFVKKDVYYEAMKDFFGNQHVLETARLLLSLIAQEDRSSEKLPQQSQGNKVMMLLGPSGVGKTFLYQKLAEMMPEYGVEWPLKEIQGNKHRKDDSDMAIFGPQGGYRDSEKKYLWDWATGNPEGILLFDEFDKQHPDLSKAMMNVLDEGRIPRGLDGTEFAWRGLIGLAANFGAKGLDQDQKATAIERDVADLINQYTLYYNGDEYTFERPNMDKVKRYFVDTPGGPIWKAPKNDAERLVHLRKLRDKLMSAYVKSGRLFNNQNKGRVQAIEIVVHWDRKVLRQFMEFLLDGRIEKYTKEKKSANSLTFTESLKEEWLMKEGFGPGGSRLFEEGARVFIDNVIYLNDVKSKLGEFAADKANYGKDWTMDYTKEKGTFITAK